MARGGMRPTAPQNNPMNVNARGGNGQSGDATQAAKYVPGLPYGEGQALMQAQQSAPLAAAPSIESASMPSGLASAAATQPIPFMEKSLRQNEPVTAGANAGAGPGMDALGLNVTDANADMNFKSQLAEYMPALIFMASRPNASPETRATVSELRALL
jgi:hypothetical protein